jgi:hypothetical protein
MAAIVRDLVIAGYLVEYVRIGAYNADNDAWRQALDSRKVSKPETTMGCKAAGGLPEVSGRGRRGAMKARQ